MPTSSILWALCLFPVVLVAGCETLGKARNDQEAAFTQSDRLMTTYPELKSGRFAIIADFEDPAHMELFEVIDVSDRAYCRLDERNGRPETGGHALRFRAGSSADTVVVRSDHATNWYMKRDWRPYDLLLTSLKSPSNDLSLRMLIGAGPPDERVAVESTIKLDEGWNVIRLDLAEIGDHIPIDDVREIRLSLDGVSEPETAFIDDILLTGYRIDLMGNAKNTSGELYVQQVGRRWKIGAGGRFEIAFGNGQIVEWYHLRSDPYRLRNLVANTVLGPTPVVVASLHPEVETTVRDFSVLGRVVLATQRIVELSNLRVVMECEWRFAESAEDESSDLPVQRWRYTIYPTGQIYVGVESVTRAEGWSPPRLGLAVSVSSEIPFEAHTNSAAQLGVPEPLRHVVYASARGSRKDGALLLFVVSDSQSTPEMLQQVDQADGRLSFIATGPLPDGESQAWACSIVLAASEDVSEEDLAERALEYGDPSALELEVGTASAPDEEQGSSTFFDASSGCYVLRPERGQVRFRLSEREAPRFSPVFRLVDAAELDAWVYVNNLVFDAVGRDAQGDLIFQVPEVPKEGAVVEVILRRPAPSETLGT
jgi:hypothetical protein